MWAVIFHSAILALAELGRFPREFRIGEVKRGECGRFHLSDVGFEPPLYFYCVSTHRDK